MAMLFAINFIFINKSFSQDLHYSQYNYSPLNLNPASTGFDDADYRIVLNNRSQWKSVTAPYKTFSVGFDMKAFALGTPKNKPNTGLGLEVNSDKDGDSHLKTTNVIASFSYNHSFNDSSIILSEGFQFGYTTKSFDMNDLNFDNQFTGDLFDPNAPTNEPVDNYKMSYIDLGFGIGGQFFRSDDFQLNAGAAMQHVNSPKNSFYNSGNVKIKPHYIANVGIRYRLSDRMQVLPSLLYMKQNSLSEFDANATFKFERDQQSAVTNIYAGAGMRLKDAIVLNIGADFKNIFAGFSYDINTSGLKKVSNKRGAIEFALIYRMKTVRALPPAPPCIIY